MENKENIDVSGLTLKQALDKLANLNMLGGDWSFKRFPSGEVFLSSNRIATSEKDFEGVLV